MTYHSAVPAKRGRKRESTGVPYTLPLVAACGIAALLSTMAFLVMGSLAIWLRGRLGIEAEQTWTLMLWGVGVVMGLTMLVPRRLFPVVPNAALWPATAAPALLMAIGTLWSSAGSMEATMAQAVTYAVALLLGMLAGLVAASLVPTR